MLRLRKPSPAMVVACISLFIGLSGVGSAAIVLKKNSVLSKHIKNGQVQSVDVKDSSLLGRDFAPGQLAAGVQGPQGPPGNPGADGSPDTPSQILAKLAQVDGSASGLDADLMDGLNSSALQRRGSVSNCTGNDKVTGLAENGNVTCASDNTIPSGPAGGDLTGAYPGPIIGPNKVTGAEVQDGSLGQADLTQGGAGSGSSFSNFTVAAGQCRMSLLAGAFSTSSAGDIVVPKLTSGDFPEGIILAPYVVGDEGDVVRILCNATAADISLSGSFNFEFRHIR